MNKYVYKYVYIHVMYYINYIYDYVNICKYIETHTKSRSINLHWAGHLMFHQYTGPNTTPGKSTSSMLASWDSKSAVTSAQQKSRQKWFKKTDTSDTFSVTCKIFNHFYQKEWAGKYLGEF